MQTQLNSRYLNIYFLLVGCLACACLFKREMRRSPTDRKADPVDAFESLSRVTMRHKEMAPTPLKVPMVIVSVV